MHARSPAPQGATAGGLLLEQATKSETDAAGTREEAIAIRRTAVRVMKRGSFAKPTILHGSSTGEKP
jgi:hypothetical protein